jgi:hypothetical protein
MGLLRAGEVGRGHKKHREHKWEMREVNREGRKGRKGIQSNLGRCAAGEEMGFTAEARRTQRELGRLATKSTKSTEKMWR